MRPVEWCSTLPCSMYTYSSAMLHQAPQTPHHRSRATTLPARHARRRQRHQHARCRAARLRVVATSEHWWEDEQEFDALTEVLLPKQLVVTTPAAAAGGAGQQLAALRFDAAFASSSCQDAAEQVWQQLGQAGPPLFLKVRTREALATLEQAAASDAAAAAATEEFLAEVTGQSWRMALDYGLNREATLANASEALLVLLGSQDAVTLLACAALGPSVDADGAGDAAAPAAAAAAAAGAGGVAVLAFEGWNAGQRQQALSSWRQLRPRLAPSLQDSAC